MASTFIAHSSFALPREEDIDLASLLITDSAGQEGKIRPLLSKGSPSRMASYTSSSSSPARKAANTTGGRPLAPARNNDLPMSMPPRIPGGGEGARIPPANGHSLFDSTSDASHSARNVTGNQHARSGLLGARNKYVGTDASPPSSSELFVCRESFLVAADFCKAISETLGKIERAVDRDGVFDTKVLAGILPRDFDCRSVDGAPKESKVHREALLELATQMSKLLKDLAKLQETSNLTYHSQLKKMREVCNQSIRSAIQADRAQSNIHMSQLKSVLEVEREKSVSDIKRELSECQKTSSSLKEEVRRLHELAEEKESERMEDSRRHEDDMEELKARHRQDLREAQREADVAREKLDRVHNSEIQKLKESFEVSKKQMKEDLDNQLRNHLDHDAEIRNMLNIEIERLKNECSKCRDQLLLVTTQATSERDKLLQRFDDEKSSMEADFQRSQAENVQALARIRGEVSDKVRKLQDEETRRKDVFDEVVKRERNELIAAHILELESLEEKQRKDLRRLEAQLEVRHSEEMSKLRRVHEQEVKRLIADNDRLHRTLLARTKVSGTSLVGGMHQFRADLDASNSILRRASSRGYSPQQSSIKATVYGESSGPTPLADGNHNDRAFTVQDISDGLKSGGKPAFEEQPGSPSRNDTHRAAAVLGNYSPPPPPPKSPHTGEKISAERAGAGYRDDMDRDLRSNEASPSTPFASMRRDNNGDEPDTDSTPGIEFHSKPSSRGRINWGSLQKSLDLQDNRRVSPEHKTSRPRDLPDSFVLEEALQSAKYAGHNVTRNANAVGTYMNKLQDYLEGSEGDTLSDGSVQRQLQAASDIFFGKYSLRDSGDRDIVNNSFSSDDSLE